MTEIERNQGTEKTGRIKKGVKYIILSLLTLLILISLTFEAPKKIVILFVIILAAFTALPKRYRKWFWLTAGSVALILIIWIFLPENNKDWRPYTFDDEIALHEEKYAIPDEENAAVIYHELMQGYDPKKLRLTFLHPKVQKIVLSGPWLSTNYPELVQWLQGHENTISVLPQACMIKTCRFRSNFKITLTDKLQIDRYTALKSWAVLLLLSGNNDIAEGRLDHGLLKYTYALEIANHLYQQKRITDFLICFGIEDLAFTPISRLLIEERLDDKQLGIVSDSLINLENTWSSDFSQCLEYNKLFIKNAFCSLVFEKNSNNHVRYSRNPEDAIWGRFRLKKLKETYWQKISMKAYTILAWFVLPDTPQKASEIIDNIYDEYYAIAEPDFAWGKESIGRLYSLEFNCRFLLWALSDRICGRFDGFYDIYLKRLTQRRGLKLLIAIKQYKNEHGTWPDSLEEIKTAAPMEAFIDPATGKQLEYENHGRYFSLYGETISIWPR